MPLDESFARLLYFDDERVHSGAFEFVKRINLNRGYWDTFLDRGRV